MSGVQKKYDKECPICHSAFVGIKAKEYCSRKCRNAAHYIHASNKAFITEPLIIIPNRNVPKIVFKHVSGSGGYWVKT